MTPSRVLAVTSQVPWPPDRGGHIRSFHLLRSLAARVPLTLLAGSRGPLAVESRTFEDVGITLRPIVLPEHTPFAVAREALAAAARSEAYVCYRRHYSSAMRDALIRAIRDERPSLLYLDHLDSYVFAGYAGGLPRVLDLHNVYSTLVERAAAETDALRRPYLRREARLLRRIEREAVRTCDVTFAVSEDDRRHFDAAGARRTVIVPNGVDCSAYEALPTGQRQGLPTVLYIGTLSWPPNATAVHFLVRDVLPALRRVLPDARLQVVGRSPGPDILAYRDAPGVEIADDVPDVRPYLAAAHVSVVPLTAGGGSRLKILEAFAAGVPVVSTSVGCEGLDVEDGHHLVVASMAEFAAATLRMLQDRPRATRLAEAGRILALAQYDWRQIGDRAAEAALGVAAPW